MGYDTGNKENDMERKSYTREFKIGAVQLMGESSKPIRQLAEELGFSENNLYNWRKQLRKKADKASSNRPRLDEKELEIRRLKARISELEEEREIFKKSRPGFRKGGKIKDTKRSWWMRWRPVTLSLSGACGFSSELLQPHQARVGFPIGLHTPLL